MAMSAARQAGPGAAAWGWLRTRGGAIAIFALLFVIWEAAVHFTGIKEYLLPPPSKVWTEFWKKHEAIGGAGST